MAETATPQVTSESDGTSNAQASGLPEELKDFKYEEGTGEGETVETPEAPETETPVETEEVESPEPVDPANKGFNKALQKVQQDNAALRRELDEIRRERAQAAKAPEPKADPLDEMTAVVKQFQDMGEDDLPTGKQVAGALEKMLSVTRKALSEKDQQIKEVGGQAQASTSELRFEKQWKAQNPTIASSYDAVIEQTNQRMAQKFSRLDPSSPEYSTAWHATHDLLTEQAKSRPKSAVPPAPSTSSRKPVPQSARPALGKAAAVTPSAKPKHNPYSDNPMDWGLGKQDQE